MNRQKNNMAGLLELVHYDNPNANLVPSTKVTNTFSHLGLIVPDINATQTRLEHYGADILKNLGEEPKMDGEIAFAYGIGDVAQRDPKGAEEIFNSLLKPGSKDFIFVADPDGNYVEVESLYHPQLDLP